ncbi:hypothetical protein XELAEV_18044256mg [Xenopus laevis]|uniref:Uncharacterized protein n=1 Tax=Xenopus laevis TaxID=8355 RepID=A0A974BYH7_XENLA|nr:hypothetical protein XELAEV_18044256mg [Xenopus laevis]
MCVNISDVHAHLRMHRGGGEMAGQVTLVRARFILHLQPDLCLVRHNPKLLLIVNTSHDSTLHCIPGQTIIPSRDRFILKDDHNHLGFWSLYGPYTPFFSSYSTQNFSNP